ncbi:MAG: 30S ribosomal protein S20 [Candidatus Blackburnbacteria bacterium]|nr:30S ribosomal protein S20 [Candidatus Blackburnbacteria bacterium]
MPVIKSSKKALRQAKRKKLVNDRVMRALKIAVKKARRSPTAASLKKAYSELDQAVKKNAIHKNKASRLKSRLARLLKKK